jgi:hypothetical protein
MGWKIKKDNCLVDLLQLSSGILQCSLLLPLIANKYRYILISDADGAKKLKDIQLM